MNEIIHTELMAETSLCGGKYIIEKKIGAGGFGITYLARHATLERKYAIKEFFLSGYNVRNNETNRISLQGIEEKDFDKFRQRFIDEARTLATLNNDAVVKVIDIFDENGTSYMVMPFVEGITLQSMVEENGPMDYEMAVNYIVRICDALSYIHSKNILHRDVTPDNIIVTPEQKTVLIDFGSARKFVDNKTQRHTTILKQGYAPLEQYSATSRKGAYTDLYSLGGVFYFILTGVRPLDATDRTMEKMKEPIELNPKIPEQINAIIMKAMEMDSSDRYQSASELEDDILSGNFPSKKEKKDVKDENVHSQEVVMPKQKRTRGNTRYLLIAFFFIILFAVIYSYKAKHQSADTQEPKSSLIVSDGETISIDSLLTENENTLLLKLDKDPKDPAILYALAYKVNNYDFSLEEVKDFWIFLISDNDVDSFLVENYNASDKYELTPQSFAFVCAARAYSNLDNSNYSNATKGELKDLLANILTQLTNQGIKSNFVYEKHD